jgi:hypothetical protein
VRRETPTLLGDLERANLNHWTTYVIWLFFSLALQPNWALAYLHETLRFTSVFSILDSR